MNAGASLTKLLAAAAIGAVVSSTVAAPWRLPEPLQESVRHAVDFVSDLWLIYGYGIRDRPFEDMSGGGPGEFIQPVVRRVRTATVLTWRATRVSARWVARHARNLVDHLQDAPSHPPRQPEPVSAERRGPPDETDATAPKRSASRPLWVICCGTTA